MNPDLLTMHAAPSSPPQRFHIRALAGREGKAITGRVEEIAGSLGLLADGRGQC